jgi:dTMP kinase
MGKLIVLEGLDGSGKSTQLNLLVNRLAKKGFETASFDFPQHGERSATLVGDYLNGKYGKTNEVTPYQASIFFACDRYDASFKIREVLRRGKIVVCDRYVASNASHQGGKIKDENERKEFFQWLYNLEFNIFQIPKPDISLILKTSPETSLKLAGSGGISDLKKLARRQAYLGEKQKDIHEEDLGHQKHALDSYLQLAEEFPQDFKIIECMEEGKLLAPDIIHEKIWAEVEKII